MPRINAVSFRHYPSIESVCRIVREAGFDSLEVSRPLFFEQLVTTATRQTFRAWAEQIGLSLYGFDCWVEVDPYHARHETLAGFKTALEFAADSDLGLVITHDPWAHVNGSRSPSECLRVNIALFKEVAAMAAEKALQLVFEPHPDTLSMDDDWAVDFIDGIGSANVGLLYDCCHYGVGRPEGYLQVIPKLGHRIQHLHFSDGDRRTYALHLPLGEGVLDLDGIIEALQGIGFQGTLTNDLYNYPLLEDGARRNVAPIQEIEKRLNLQTP